MPRFVKGLSSTDESSLIQSVRLCCAYIGDIDGLDRIYHDALGYKGSGV